MVIEIKDKIVTAVSRQEGYVEYKAKAIILAMGCRERPRGALSIPGFRPAGIYSAGTAQRLVNIEGFMPGREVVILGSGDIGLIMARRMTLEGAKVKLVAELMPYSGGLKRNIVQCLDDYGIPLKLSHTVTGIDGKDRLRGVFISRVDEEMCIRDRLKTVLGKKRAFIVTDSFLYMNGYTKPITDKLNEMGIVYQTFSDVQPDPTLANAQAGAKAMNAFKPDVIICLLYTSRCV